MRRGAGETPSRFAPIALFQCHPLRFACPCRLGRFKYDPPALEGAAIAWGGGDVGPNSGAFAGLTHPNRPDRWRGFDLVADFRI